MSGRRLPRGFALASGLLLLFVILPLVTILLASTPASLWQALSDSEVGRALAITFLAAALATSLGLLTGLPLGYLLARVEFPGKRIVEAVVDLPVIVPHTAAGIALLMVWGRRGMLGGLLAPLGLYFTDNVSGIVVAMCFVSLPYLVNMTREAIAQVDAEMERAALVDGASAWQVFRFITLPQAWRGVVGGALMMWARGISEFGAVIILAYHPRIVPTLIFERFEGFGLAAAQPVAALLLIAVVLVFGLLRWLLLPEHGT